MTTETLSTSEVTKLAHCETIIERGLVTFLEVGDALMDIRDGRLYRVSHERFEDYCRERWGWGRSYANKLITAAEVTHILQDAPSTSMGTIVPKQVPPNAAVAGALGPLRNDPDKLIEAFHETVKRNGDHPTAAQTTEVVDLMRPPLGDNQIKETRVGDTARPDPTPPAPVTDLQDEEIESGVRALVAGWGEDLERIYLRAEEEMEFRDAHEEHLTERHHMMLRAAHDRIIEGLPNV